MPGKRPKAGEFNGREVPYGETLNERNAQRREALRKMLTHLAPRPSTEGSNRSEERE